MLDKYDQEEVDRLKALKNKVVTYTAEELAELKLQFMDRQKDAMKVLAVE